MRFLNTDTLRFEQVPDSELDLDKNQYAILSHRWFDNEDEVSYEDLLHPSSSNVFSKKGYAKIRGFCKLAFKANCRYGWIDTCCINKGNSSELSEAINSMYLWYSYSKICIAYLGDVPEKKLEDSEWFNRGWTLQELIAPKEVSFFDQNWNPLGTKSDLLANLSRKTKIPRAILNHTAKLSTCSVAQRFSWAATRITKRIEDRAYSLMGLFDISMPMIYGERGNAFIRLQQHIIQKSKDESIFAWAMEQQEAGSKSYSGLYAPSPSVYINCSDMVQTPGSLGFSESNGDLSIRVWLYPHSPGTYLAVLQCSHGYEIEKATSIVLARTKTEDEFVRVKDVEGVSVWQVPTPKHQVQKRLIRVPVAPDVAPATIFYGFWLRTIQPRGYNQCDITILSNSEAPELGFICQKREDQGNTGIVRIKPKSKLNGPNFTPIRWIRFGFDKGFNPVIWLAKDNMSETLEEVFNRTLATPRKALKPYEYEQAFNENLLNNTQGQWAYRAKSHTTQGWSEMLTGSMTLRVDGAEGLEEHEVEGMKISVQLHPHHRLPTASISHIDDSGFRTDTKSLWVWVVDITEPPLRPSTMTTLYYLCLGIIFCPCMIFYWCSTDSKEKGEAEQGMELAEGAVAEETGQAVEELNAETSNHAS
ncbi:HET-domain-containing protein [Stipitochalara longipes BDJ]|nr:HET-domain-containing protein [Stipitochalara longipes BDJ]